MFEVSWGELLVLTGVGITLVGRRDLPKVSRVVGTQMGRVVGLLQGARARADRFTAQNELRQLQNELRSGLRELDAVKSELAVAASGPTGIIGRGLGATVASANRGERAAPRHISDEPDSGVRPTLDSMPLGASGLGAIEQSPTASDSIAIRELAPRTQAVAAVAEEEWEKQGIAFQSRGERGDGTDGGKSGSTLLADLLQQSLIHDQYDRVVQEQEDALQSRADRIQEQRRETPKEEKKT